MKILVTGGAGFIGSHISDALLAEGHDIHIMDDLSGGRMENVPVAAIFHLMDITSPEVNALFEQERFEVLVHLAAQMDVRKSVADPKFDGNINVLGFLNLMEAGRKNGLRKVVFSSTGGAIYGEPDYVPQDEEHKERPLSPYGITKLVTEKYLFFYEQTHGIEWIALRYANVYGPRQNPHGEAGVVAIFTRMMLEGRQPVINGDGFQTRDYTYVGDVVRANMLALHHKESGIINIGTGVETNVVELFHIIHDLTGAKIEEKHVPAKAGEQMRSVLSYQRATDLLGWKPEMQLKEGLAQTVAWFQEKIAVEAG